MANEVDITKLVRTRIPNVLPSEASVIEEPVAPAGIPPLEPPHPSKLLDIARPDRWQLLGEVYLDSLKPREAEQWLEHLRGFHDVMAKRVKMKVEAGVAQHCFVCGKPFPHGQPGGGVAHYIDGERNFINVWCCHPSEYPQLLQKAKEKDDRFRHAEEEREKAARAAAVKARQARD